MYVTYPTYQMCIKNIVNLFSNVIFWAQHWVIKIKSALLEIKSSQTPFSLFFPNHISYFLSKIQLYLPSGRNPWESPLIICPNFPNYSSPLQRIVCVCVCGLLLWGSCYPNHMLTEKDGFGAAETIHKSYRRRVSSSLAADVANNARRHTHHHTNRRGDMLCQALIQPAEIRDKGWRLITATVLYEMLQ